ncbi:MAG: hypothetical protein O2948_01180 [Proteobacteria bacterium]|nr:hypothetical protein [Pseudomonadota bacterium]MDA0928202.1 hypothetical protein [Pseudomonadota bacterium]
MLDIAVDPAYQGRGPGRIVMEEVCRYLDREVPSQFYVCLIADRQWLRKIWL